MIVATRAMYMAMIQLFFRRFPDFNNLDVEIQILACQGIASRGLENIPRAKSLLYKSLKVVIEQQQYFPLTHTLPGIALLFVDEGEVERAVELYSLASTQGIVANSKWFADIAGEEIAAAAAQLPAEVVEAARARGQSLDMVETGKKLLNELAEKGWGNEDLLTEKKIYD